MLHSSGMQAIKKEYLQYAGEATSTKPTRPKPKATQHKSRRFEVGDKVEVVSGDWHGRSGECTKWLREDGAMHVKLHSCGIQAIKYEDLKHKASREGTSGKHPLSLACVVKCSSHRLYLMSLVGGLVL